MAQDKKRRDKFLRALELTGHVGKACSEAKLSRRTAYNWRIADEAFAVEWEAAQEMGTDALEDEAVRRASEGCQRKKFTGKGVAVIDPATGEQYVEHEYSDTLLIFMLKARRPDKFKERNEIKVGGSGVPIELVGINVTSQPRRAIEEKHHANGNGKPIGIDTGRNNGDGAKM